MADDVTNFIVEVMEESRSLLYPDDEVLTIENANREPIAVLKHGWSLIPPQAAQQDIATWVLRLAPWTVTKESMADFSFVTCDGRRFERDWANPLRTISSVWIANVRQIGEV